MQDAGPGSDRDAVRDGAEVLLVDGDERVRDGFRRLLSTAGLVVTATHDTVTALDLAGEKYFAVAVLDVDTPTTDAGLETMAQLKRLSPGTTVVLMAGRQTFSVAVEGFRRGAADVVAKSPENVKYLSDTVWRFCDRAAADSQRERLLDEVLEVHEAFLRRLMEASRKAAEAEERASGSSLEVKLDECVVLVVDDNVNTAPGIEQALAAVGGYRVVSVLTGGEALDYVGQNQFQLAMVKEGLPDLPSSMVAKSLRAETDEGIVLLFSHPTAEGRPGRADVIEATQKIELIPELTSGDQLVQQIRELREAFVAKARERRYLQVFRRDHYEFLRRYADLRRQITAMTAKDAR